MKTVLNFIEMCDLLNQHHNDPEYVIAFRINHTIHLIKYAGTFPHDNDEMQALIRKAREEVKGLN